MNDMEQHIKDMIENFKGSGRTLAEFLAETLKDRIVEIYLGDSYEEISVDQISTAYPAVFCGKIIAAYGECLVIKCAFVNESKKVQIGKIMFINERSIRALTEIDNRGVMQDMFWRSHESLDMIKFMEKNGSK